MRNISLFEALTTVQEDSWLGRLTGKKLKPVQFIDKSDTSMTVSVGGMPFKITRVTDIQNPRTKQFSYLWTARNKAGKAVAEHSDVREVIKKLQTL